jgi:hypothetical protein
MKQYIAVIRNESNILISSPIFSAGNDQEAVLFIENHLKQSALTNDKATDGTRYPTWYRYSFGTI